MKSSEFLAKMDFIVYLCQFKVFKVFVFKSGYGPVPGPLQQLLDTPLYVTTVGRQYFRFQTDDQLIWEVVCFNSLSKRMSRLTQENLFKCS